MNYFTAELWQKLNHADKDIRTKADWQWKESSRRYRQYFETIKHHIPKYVLTELDKTCDFHDYIIDEIEIKQNCKKRHVCRIGLYNGERRIYIEMSDISSIKIDIITFQSCVLGRLTWGYHEFELTETNTLRLAVLCDMENEMVFEFKKIALRDGRSALLSPPEDKESL